MGQEGRGRGRRTLLEFRLLSLVLQEHHQLPPVLLVEFGKAEVGRGSIHRLSISISFRFRMWGVATTNGGSSR